MNYTMTKGISLKKGYVYKWPHRIYAIGANVILTVLTDQEKTLVKCRHRITVVMK